MGISVTARSTLTPAGCPAVQLNSDTSYPEITSDPIDEGLSLLHMPGACPPVTGAGCNLEIPTTPFLGLINLLEQLVELRETFYLLDYWFIIKGYNSGYIKADNSQMEEKQRAGSRERARSFHAIPEWLSPKASCVHQPWSSPNPILLGFYGVFIT